MNVETFISFMGKHSGGSQSEASIGRLAGLLRPVIDRYKGLSEDEQYTVRDFIRKFNGAYSPTVKNNVLTQSAIKTIIDGNDPAYMQCRRPNGFLSYMYHSVALIGYDFTSSSTQIEIMDPAYECFKDCTYSNGDWTFAFGTYTYTWIKTITID